MSDYLIRYVLLNFISVAGGAILVGFIAVRFSEGKYSTVAACSVMLLIAILTIIFSRMKKMPQIVPALMLMGFYGMLCIMVTWLGEALGMNFLFIYMYPLTTIMLLGMRLGIIFSSVLLGIISLQMGIPGMSRYSYAFTIPIHMIVTYFLVFSVMIVVEITRKTKDRLIDNQNLRLQELRKEADAANRTKSNFLASMSHEIRTPMNAISGMSELLLRRDLPDDARTDVQDIKQAASNLLSIINDILDISKIEAGKLEIMPLNYMLSSLINDAINIIRLKLVERPIRFYTNIDGNIPNNLIGDEVRVRQIFLNLLSNAAKYTQKGQISMSIAIDKQDQETVWLRIVITDTGQGIRPEDQEKLFGDFVQVDTKKNRAVEGTGLGLAITRKLCHAMGGDIFVQSEHGKGSVFTVTIPQGYLQGDSFAGVHEPEQKNVLVYEGRKIYADSVCWALQNMHVPHTLVSAQDDFAEALQREDWFFVFSGYGLYNKIKPVMESLPVEKRPPLALMVEWGIEAYIPNVRFISLPVQSLSIANTLNGKADRQDFFEASASGDALRFTIPCARILVVDDIATNLKVAEGLLMPYKAVVDTSLSGMEALEKIIRRDYDIVFMDHMMPEMDGIETTEKIRAWEQSDHSRAVGPIPIIALTANAVSGMREMFISKGFSDFLAKPIDVSKLDEILDKWIPKEKVKGNDRGSGLGDQGSEEKRGKSPAPASAGDIPTTLPTLTPRSLSIPGIDTKKGITLVGGKETVYLQVLALFCNDAEQRLPLLQTVPAADALTLFVTQIHALKSASASIGADGVSVQAAELETAGKAGDLTFIGKSLPAFAKNLAELIINIKNSLENDRNPHIFHELAAALHSENSLEIDRILDELSNKSLDSKLRELLEEISDYVLMAEYQKAGEILDSIESMIAGVQP